MKKILIIIIALIGIFSCQERIVELAETDYAEITEPTDISPIYIFYSEEDGSAEFNRNNMIGTTNWLVNIDKRLRLQQVVPHLQFLYNKRHGDGMHKNDAARNYFSCSNPDIQNLAFIDFTDVVYNEETITAFLENRVAKDSFPECYVSIKSLDEISIGKNFIIKKTDSSNFLEDLNSQTEMDSIADRVFLNFNSKLSFQDYIRIKSEVLKVDTTMVKISNTEFIYK